ncbi:MAG: hypothetical protein QOH90_1777 [Actinomycetota bacterium]|nr:hypothetical protein [Actinomycetota bacterium]
MPVGLITGASKGLGRALATHLAASGWDLVIDARHATPLFAVAEELGPAVTALAGNVADENHRTAVADAIEALGGIDLLVNNASTLGPLPRPQLDSFDATDLEDVYRVNVFAPLALTQRLLRFLKRASGTVVNITSDAAVEPYEGWGGYGSSKAALDQVTAILGAELPELHVYSFDPGDMRTEMQQQAFPGEDISDRADPESVVPALMRLISERPPSGRYKASDLLVAAGGR